VDSEPHVSLSYAYEPGEESLSKECVNLLNDTSRKMTNPLLQKYEELYGKKEPLKMPRIGDYEGEETIADELKKTKPRKLAKCYDPDSLKVSFHQVAEQLQTGKAKIASMSMEIDSMSIMRNKIIFEVYVDD